MTPYTTVEVIRICMFCKKPVSKLVKVNTRMSPEILADFKKFHSKGTSRYTICADCKLRSKR